VTRADLLGRGVPEPYAHKDLASAMSYSATDAESIAAPCLLRGARLRNALTAACDSQPSKRLTRAGVDQLGGDGEVEAAQLPRVPVRRFHAAGKVGLALLGLNGDGEVENYEGIYRLCYVRGPEGIIVELAEQIG
jgi:hypothetical protein